jgi:hypothetical protein
VEIEIVPARVPANHLRRNRNGCGKKDDGRSDQTSQTFF